MESSSLIIF